MEHPSSSKTHPPLSLRSHKSERYFVDISKFYYVWIIKSKSWCIILGLLQAFGEFRQLHWSKIKKSIMTVHYNQVKIFSFVVHKNPYFVTQYFVAIHTNYQEKSNL